MNYTNLQRYKPYYALFQKTNIKVNIILYNDMNINTTIHGPGGHLTKTKITNRVSRNEYKSKKYKQIEMYKTSQ